MSGEMMTFPKTWEEYEKYWGFNDSDEVYTNNARLIPSFRVKQWLNHIKEAEPKWIPVTEQLPDKDVPVLVYLFDDNPYIAWINCDGEWQTEEFITDLDYLPKVWMPLPEPYREVTE